MYIIKQQVDGYEIIDPNTDDVLGSFDTEEDARIAYVNEFGYLPPTEEEIAKFGWLSGKGQGEISVPTRALCTL